MKLHANQYSRILENTTEKKYKKFYGQKEGEGADGEKKEDEGAPKEENKSETEESQSKKSESEEHEDEDNEYDEEDDDLESGASNKAIPRMMLSASKQHLNSFYLSSSSSGTPR